MCYNIKYSSSHTGIYFLEREITPPVQGCRRVDKDGVDQKAFTEEVEIRCLVEGQFLAKLSHATKLGFDITSSTRVLATGGASQNTRILQVISCVYIPNRTCLSSVYTHTHTHASTLTHTQIIADIFNSSVFILEGTSNSASVGGAYRAKHSLMDEGAEFRSAVEGALPYKEAASPQEENHKVQNYWS